MYPYVLMVLVVIFYAGNILVGKALNDLPPFTIAFFRVLIAFLVLLPFGLKSAWRNRSVFVEYKKPLLIMTLTGVTFFNTFIYGALQFTTATNVSVLESVIPVATVLLSIVMLKERIVGIQWAGILLSFFGALWVVMDGRLTSLSSLAWNVGDGIMIGAILTWAIYSIYVKRYMHVFPALGAPLVMLGISVVVLFPIALIEWMVTGIPSIGGFNHLAGLFYLGTLPSVVALVFYNRAVELLSPSRAAVFLNFLPIFTIVGAYLWLDETITMMQIVGALIVISGVILTTQFQRDRRTRPLSERNVG